MMTGPRVTPDGVAAEDRRGRLVADLAAKIGVGHLVYSSIGGADQHTGIPYVENKGRIEEHIRGLGLPATILRPAYFMENLEFMRTWIAGGTWSMPLPADGRLQMVAVDDIGAFVALALESPSTFVGRAIELAGDEPTMTDMAETLGRVLDRPVQFSEMPIEQARGFDPHLAILSEWLRTHSYGADIPSLRAVRPELLTLEAWLIKSQWGVSAAPAR